MTVDRGLRQRASARLALRGVAAALLVVCAAGCSETTSSNVSLSAAGSSGPTIAFEFDRRPAGRRVQPAGRQHVRRGAGAPAGDRVARGRGELPGARLSRRPGDPRADAYFLGLGRVRRRKVRALRIRGEEAGGRAGSDPWGIADEAMLRRIARASVDRIAAFLRNPDGPAPPTSRSPMRPSRNPSKGRAAGRAARRGRGRPARPKTARTLGRPADPLRDIALTD